MYGSTCLTSTDIPRTYTYMYSTKVETEVCGKIGAQFLQSAYNVSESIMGGISLLYSMRTGSTAITLKQLENLDRLYDMKHLEADWNGHGSKPISEKVISRSKTIIDAICEQPHIYPTGRATIQMQYELEDRSYLEFEVFEEKIVCMKVPKRVYAEASFEILETVDTNKLNKIVKEFYGR